MLQIQENISLAKRTTFEIGGNARYFVHVKKSDDIKEALLWARSKRVPHVFIGGGSNILIPDEGLEALVVHIASAKWHVTSTTLFCEAGTVLLDMIRATNTLGLGGWESLSGIPGTIGGAVRGNAGAFGSEIKDFVVSVRALNIHTLENKSFSAVECDFAYRNSFFKKNPEWVILDVSLQLRKGDPAAFTKKSEDTIAERERRHIQNVRAAGSYFMNPIASQSVREAFEKEKSVASREGRVPAGWLIEKVGMKGFRIGDAMASEQHPNYLVNAGQATARDVKKVANEIKKAVKEKFDIQLTEEAVVF